jgi:hypothetical protein
MKMGLFATLGFCETGQYETGCWVWLLVTFGGVDLKSTQAPTPEAQSTSASHTWVQLHRRSKIHVIFQKCIFFLKLQLLQTQ